MLALVQGLPPEAAAWRDKESSWTTRDEIQHAILDRILMQQGAKRFSLPNLRPGRMKKQKVMSVSDFSAHYRAQMGGEKK